MTDSVGVITGSVRDSAGPVEGANIMIPGTRSYGVANRDGRFRMAVPPGSMVFLRTRAIGYLARADSFMMPADRGVDLDIVLRQYLHVFDDFGYVRVLPDLPVMRPPDVVPSPIPMPDRQSLPDRDVYAALVDSSYPRPRFDTLLVGDSTIQFHVPPLIGGVRDAPRGYEEIPPELPAKLAAVSAARVPSSRLSWPRPISIVGSDELKQIFAHGVDGWPEFYRRYPKQREIIYLSPVAYSADTLDALVYLEYSCGPLCRGGEAVWLSRRGEPTGKWRLRRRVTFWAS